MTEEQLRDAFEKQKPLLLAWGDAVAGAILSRVKTSLGSLKDIHTFLKVPCEPRVKDTDSFLAKALRRGKNYEKPLEEITDKVGVRFVVLLLSELKIIEDVIENCPLWEAEKARDFEAEKIERPHYFDYQSIHYIVRTQKPTDCGHVQVPANTPCEVQVRTLLQHAYAELAHDMTYKPSLVVDREVSRYVAKSAALVEATDEIFVRAHDKVAAASAELQRVCEIAAEEYVDTTGLSPSTDYRLCFNLLDSFREQLVELTREHFKAFLADNDFIAEKIKERAPMALLFRQPCVLVLYYLIAQHPDLVPKKWAADQKHLEIFYVDLGLSTVGRLS